MCFLPIPAIIAAWAGPEQMRREHDLLDRWSRIYSRFNEVLSGIYQTLQRAQVSLEEIFSILDVQEHLGDMPGATDLNGVRGDVTFDSVKFRYEELERPILERIDLDVKAGQTLAIVGPSGAGKTTLMALMMRFYDPQEGVVRLDGHDLRKFKQRSLRRKIGTVLQDPLLFNDSVRNNIAYGQLMRARGSYASLVERQTRGLVRNEGE